MKRDSSTPSARWHLPLLGQRILKTTLAVFLCLLINYLRGRTGKDMSTESAITAIICMQPYVRDSREYAINRLAGTLLASLLGLSFLLLMTAVPALSRNLATVYFIMALGVLASLYSAVLIKKSDAASLVAIVFLCIVVNYPDITDPLQSMLRRIVDVFIGTTVAIGVNVFRLPRRKRRDLVFFVRTRELCPDRFSAIPTAGLFKLNYLYNDGAKICLMSEHAPAFFALQMSSARLSVPLIVMDGAALYDAVENRYVQTETISAEDSASLRERLAQLGISYFIYTVHNNKTCIFHQGKLTVEEKLVYDRMRRSPYRSYLEGENYDLNEVVYYKVIAPEKQIAEIERQLRTVLPKSKLRVVSRPQAGVPGIYGLYIYAHTATMEQSQSRLMRLLRETDPTLTPLELRTRYGYRTERDTMHLLTKLENQYEPVALFAHRKRKSGRRTP